MKRVIILPDGAADEPLPQLDGRTPLEAARTPHLDWIAEHGRLGRAVTIPEGYVPGTDVGTLTVFGYDLPLDVANEIERALFAQLFASSDQKEGMAAFVAKREPKFENR